jgi:hypothetical protein
VCEHKRRGNKAGNRILKENVPVMPLWGRFLLVGETPPWKELSSEVSHVSTPQDRFRVNIQINTG